MSGNRTVRAFRDRDLEPGSPAMRPGLADGDTGNGEDLPGEEEPKARVPAITFLEQSGFFVKRYANPIILDKNNEFLALYPAPNRDGGDMLPVPDCVVEQVKKTFESIGSA